MSKDTDQTAPMKPKRTDKKTKTPQAKTKSKATIFSILVVFFMSLSSIIISLQDQDQHTVQTISQVDILHQLCIRNLFPIKVIVLMEVIHS